MASSSANPFPLPATLKPLLQRVLSYWDDLKRGENAIPFSDDVNLSDFPDVSDRLLLLDVFSAPERFRFNFLGESFTNHQIGATQSAFLDEIPLKGQLIFLRAQSSATVEAGAPTFYRFGGGPTARAFSRILLPLWKDGQIGMLLGASDAE